MRSKSFIQWGFLVFIAAILIYFEAIHLHVVHYNVFLLLLISFTFIGILGLWLLERMGPAFKGGDQQGEVGE
jgi:hypothetical protein